MHTALTLNEILEEIVSYLPSRDVLAVARVCRDFYSVSIAGYWNNKIVTLDRLLRLLPLSQHKPLTFPTELGSDAFDPVRAVVPNIRNLLLRFWPPIDHQVFDTLSDRIAHLFTSPGLRRIDWRVSAQSHVRMFVALLGPSIRTIIVSFPNTESAFDLVSMFHAISTRSPGITSLNVSILYPSHTFMEPFVQCIRALDLRQAVLQFNISPTALRVLAGLPHLEYLDCECHGDLGVWEPAPAPAPARRLFAALRSLRINGYHHAFMTVLEAISRPFALESLQVNIGDGLEATISQTLSLLGSAAPQLRTLVLRSHTSVLKTAHRPDPTLVSSVPSGLLQCPLLEHVHIVYPYALQWDDADFARLARALPRLRTLRLNAYPSLPPIEPRATFDAVRSFATHCPSLLELELFLLVAAPLPSSTSAPLAFEFVHVVPPPLEHTAMLYLDFGKSPLARGTRAADVAHYLLRLFPRLKELRSAETDVSEAGCRWESPEIARARSAEWDIVRATYSAERDQLTAEQTSPSASLRLDMPAREREPEQTRDTPSIMDGPMSDTVPAWPFA